MVECIAIRMGRLVRIIRETWRVSNFQNFEWFQESRRIYLTKGYNLVNEELKMITNNQHPAFIHQLHLLKRDKTHHERSVLGMTLNT